jgi:hypothetical protein
MTTISVHPTNRVEKAVLAERGRQDAPITMGIDPSRGGKDKFSIVFRQGRRFKAVKSSGSVSDSEIGTMEGVGHIIDAIERVRA